MVIRPAPAVVDPGAAAANTPPVIAGGLAPRRRQSRIPLRGWGLLGLLALTSVAAIYLLAGGTLVGQDSVTQFYPWYALLGERLRAGDIPGWNPAQFGGAPFAGDPQSGWTYLPAMLAFGLLPFWLAVPVYLVGHVALALGATYALARKLALGVVGSLIAAAAYAYAGPVLGRAPCCPATFQVAAWSPVTLLGLELAIVAASWRARSAGWSLAGLALSQILATWIGQGAYYALLALGAYAVYRTIFVPAAGPDGSLPSPAQRVARLALHGSGVLTIGFGLAAAGILPRLEYNAQSNLAGGRYQGAGSWAAAVGGVSWSQLDRAAQPSLYYPGGAAIALGVVALLLVRRGLAVPYCAALALGAAILVLPARTPLHVLLYSLLPRFESLHRHWPERVTMVAYIAPALLAGTAVDSLSRWRRRPRRLLRALALPAVVGLGLLAESRTNHWPAVAVLLGTLLVGATLLPRPLARLAPSLLLLLVAGDLMLMNLELARQAPFGGYHRLDVASYDDADGAVAFLRERTRDEPARFVGYDPGLSTSEHGRATLYRSRFADPEVRALLVNNRATLFGLEDAQGYNPVQPARTVDFLIALNGVTQEYHDANVLEAGIESPLLDLLNVRYLLIPAALPPGRDDLQRLSARYPTVYGDDAVRILENREALPRAWLVHQARQLPPDQALMELARGAVDPRQTALLEGSPPPLAPAAIPANDRAVVDSASADSLRLTTRSDAPALLMMSEVAYPAWKATVDGEPASVLTADHLLRAVAVPAGEHTVELRFASSALQIGTWISLATIAVVTGLLLGLPLVARRRAR